MLNEVSWDLIFSSNANVELSGFGPVELSDHSSWRWCLGPRGSVHLRSRFGRAKIIFRILVPIEGSKVSLSWNNCEVFDALTERPFQAVGGAIEVLSSEDGGTLIFECSKFNSEGSNFSSDPRPMSMSFECLSMEIIPDALLEDGAKFTSTFCAVPFVQGFISSDSCLYPCVESAEHSQERDFFAAEKILDEKSLLRAWNSDLMQEIRRTMAEGKVPASCRNCFRKEMYGASSLRKMQNDIYGRFVEDAFKRYCEGGRELFPMALDIRLSNLCNLACKMCFPVYSQGTINNWLALTGASFVPPEDLNWSRDWGRLSKFLEMNVGSFYFAGGEPFIIPEFKKSLKKLISDGRAKSTEIVFNTNCTLLRDDVLDLFKNFQGVTLIASIDGVGAVNDWIRYPSKFEVLDSNLRKLYASRADLGITRIRFNTTVQAYNVEHLCPLLEYLERSFPEIDWFPDLNILSEPRALSIDVLPAERREFASSALSGYADAAADRLSERQTKNLVGIISALKGAFRADLWSEFQRYDHALRTQRER